MNEKDCDLLLCPTLFSTATDQLLQGKSTLFIFPSPLQLVHLAFIDHARTVKYDDHLPPRFITRTPREVATP